MNMGIDCDRVLPIVFVLEGVLNTTSFLLLYFFPLWSLLELGVPEGRISAELASMTQWFGSLCFVLGYIGLTVPANPRVIEALLVADILWLVVGWQFSVAFVPRWTFSTHFQLWIVVVLAAARIVFLARDYSKAGAREASKKRSQRATPVKSTTTTVENPPKKSPRAASRSPKRRVARQRKDDDDDSDY